MLLFVSTFALVNKVGVPKVLTKGRLSRKLLASCENMSFNFNFIFPPELYSFCLIYPEVF